MDLLTLAPNPENEVSGRILIPLLPLATTGEEGTAPLAVAGAVDGGLKVESATTYADVHDMPARTSVSYVIVLINIISSSDSLCKTI